MDEIVKSPTFWTVVGGLGGQIISYIVLLNLVKQKQEFQDKEIERLGNELKTHKEDAKAKDLTWWSAVNEIKSSMSEMMKTLTRVETKLEFHNKGDNS